MIAAIYARKSTEQNGMSGKESRGGLHSERVPRSCHPDNLAHWLRDGRLRSR